MRKELAKVGSKYCQILIKPSKYCQLLNKPQKPCKSCKISPNLVALLMSKWIHFILHRKDFYFKISRLHFQPIFVLSFEVSLQRNLLLSTSSSLPSSKVKNGGANSFGRTFKHRWEPWFSGYGQRLMFERSWVWILAPYTGWIWHWFFVKIVSFVWKDGK